MRLNKLYELNGENLTLGANEFENLAKKVLTYTGESQKDYEKLIYDWASFIAKVYKIENAKLKFDKVLKNSGIRGCVSALEVVEGENIIHINPILMDKAPLNEIHEVLESIAHEMGHILYQKKHPVTYKKFDNETGQQANYLNYHALRILSQALENEAMKQNWDMMYQALYIENEEEKFARRSGLVALEKLSKRMVKVCAENKDFQSSYMKGKIESVKNYIEREKTNNEKQEVIADIVLGKGKVKIINKNDSQNPKDVRIQENIKPQIYSLLEEYLKIYDVLAFIEKKSLPFDEMIINFLNQEEFLNQDFIQKLFLVYLQNYQIVGFENVVKIISLPNNKNSAKQMLATLKFIENCGAKTKDYELLFKTVKEIKFPHNTVDIDRYMRLYNNFFKNKNKNEDLQEKC